MSTDVVLHSEGEINVYTHLNTQGDARFLILKHTPEYPKARYAFEIPQACFPISIMWVYLGTV